MHSLLHQKLIFLASLQLRAQLQFAASVRRSVECRARPPAIEKKKKKKKSIQKLLKIIMQIEFYFSIVSVG